MVRVALYIDGFNLYHGLKTKHGRKYLWLDLHRVAMRLVREGQEVAVVRYFTAAVRNDPAAEQRQQTYLAALRVRGDVDITLGRFQEKRLACRGCGKSWRSYEEKETDVNIAVALLADAAEDLFDLAIVLSADSDLCPAVRTLKRVYPNKRVIAVFPPRRHSDDLRRAVDANFTLGEGIIRQCQLDHAVTDGTTIYTRPAHWS
jgi:uncharacterized LabA/DUF88 family protein